MKPMKSNLAMLMGAAAALLLAAPSADALFVNSALGKAKDVAKSATTTVVDTTKKGANAVVDTTKKGANAAVAAVSGAATAVKDWAVKNATVALKGAQSLAKVFSTDTLNAITNGIKNRVKNYASKIESTMETAYAKAKAMAKDFVLNTVWAKGKAAYNRIKTKLETPHRLLRELLQNADAKAKLNTLFKKVASGGIDDEVKSIVKYFAEKISGTKWAMQQLQQSRRAPVALCDASKSWPTVAYAAWPKSFSLTIGASLSAISPKIVGVSGELRFGIVADLGKDKDKSYDVRGYFHVAAAVGGGSPGIDAAANVMLGFSALKTLNASGGFFGIFGEAGAKVGGEIEIEWGFADGTLVGEPGFSVGIGVQDPTPGGAIMFNGGYAFTFTNDGLDS